MNEVEKRRQELLQHTRKMYSDSYVPPAVHPRFGTAYHSLYKSETGETDSNGSFGVRLIIAVLLFGLFAAAGRAELNTQMVVQEIEQEFQSFVDLPIFD